MFLVIPCVDVLGGKVVRVEGGDPKLATIYYQRPLEAARLFAERGAQWLHLVDLDATLGSGENTAAIVEVAESLDVKIELGGGVRSAAAARAWLERVDRVILGTLAITSPELVAELVAEFGADRVGVSIDAKHGRVAVRGWTQVTDVAATDLAARMAQLGVGHVVYTDIARDGRLLGVDPAPVAAMRAAFDGTLIAGGGVASDADLGIYEDLGLQGAIVGKALYEGKITYPRVA